MKNSSFIAIVLCTFLPLFVLCGCLDSTTAEETASKHEFSTPFIAATEKIYYPKAKTTAQTTEKVPAESTVSSGEQVWVSKSGDKYHSRSTCSNMKTATQVPLSAAESLGYNACAKCY